MTWGVPGYQATELLGFGASGEVWRGVELLTGETVALKRLRVSALATDRERLRREGALLAALRHEHVLPLRGVVETADDVVLVLDHAAGGSLAGLLSRRDKVGPGECVTVLAPLAGALAAAHARGLVHGDLSPGNVLLTADGRPLLGDLGTARLLGEPAQQPRGTAGYVDPAVLAGGQPGPASDGYALGALGWHLLSGAPPASPERPEQVLTTAGVPAALARLIARCLDPDPHQRPAASAIATQALAACAAAPLQLTGGLAPMLADGLTHAVRPRPAQPAAAPAAGRHRADGVPARLAARVAVAALVLAVAAGGGLAWGVATRPEQPAAVPGQRPAPADAPATDQTASAHRATTEPADTDGSSADWAAVLARLDARREIAFARADPAALDGVYVRGSAPWRADGADVARLVARHAHAPGVRHRSVRVRLVRGTADRATVRAVDRMAGYQVVEADGTVAQRTPARGARTVIVELARTSAGWRIAALR